MQFNKHAVVLLPGRERLGLLFTVHSLRSAEELISHYFAMLPLSFNANYGGIIVLKPNANRAIILAKILSYAPRAWFLFSWKRSLLLF